MKSFFEWDKEFETGNKQIDEQHYGLVKVINKLMQTELTDDEESYGSILLLSQKLSEYVVLHFESEEEIMNRYNIDSRHSEKHKISHIDFVKKVTEHNKDMTEKFDREKVEDMIEYLIRWLAYHILNTDKSLFRQIENIEKNKISPSEAYEKEEIISDTAADPLLKALKALYLMVSEKNKELEKLVEERTCELVEANKKLQGMSLIDELTGLYNRRFAMGEIEQLIYNWERYKTSFSVLYIDVDKFKGVNDKFGHEKGDMVLKWIADHLKNNVRKTDNVCRIGGDEFIIICVHYKPIDLEKLAEKLIRKYKSGNINKYWQPSLSIGIKTMDEHIKTAEDILKKADNAMYLSKQSGGNKISIAD